MATASMVSSRAGLHNRRCPSVTERPPGQARAYQLTGAQVDGSRKLPGLTRLQTSKVWPKEDGSPTPAYRLLDLYFADYAAASAAAAEAGPLVAATVEHATGGVVIAFAEVIEDA